MILLGALQGITRGSYVLRPVEALSKCDPLTCACTGRNGCGGDDEPHTDIDVAFDLDPADHAGLRGCQFCHHTMLVLAMHGPSRVDP